MRRDQLFYPDSEAVEVLEEIIGEIDLLIHYPAKTVRNSGFYGIDVENESIPFLMLYKPEYGQKILMNFVTEPVTFPFIDKILQSRQIRRAKQEIYRKLNEFMADINRLLEKESWMDRKESLEVAKKISERVKKEVKSDLLE